MEIKFFVVTGKRSFIISRTGEELDKQPEETFGIPVFHIREIRQESDVTIVFLKDIHFPNLMGVPARAYDIYSTQSFEELIQQLKD